MTSHSSKMILPTYKIVVHPLAAQTAANVRPRY
jgi:hypothetical protein